MIESERRLIVALDGSRGIRVAQCVLELLSETELEIHLILSPSTIRYFEDSEEVGTESIHALADEHYHYRNIGAPMASGSWGNRGMIVIPCSMGFVGELSRGITGNLLTRAADVTLKENRPLVLTPYEVSYTLPHIDNMKELIRAGATIIPPTIPEEGPDESQIHLHRALARRLFLLCDPLPEPDVESGKS